MVVRCQRAVNLDRAAFRNDGTPTFVNVLARVASNLGLAMEYDAQT